MDIFALTLNEGMSKTLAQMGLFGSAQIVDSCRVSLEPVTLKLTSPDDLILDRSIAPYAIYRYFNVAFSNLAQVPDNELQYRINTGFADPNNTPFFYPEFRDNEAVPAIGDNRTRSNVTLVSVNEAKEGYYATINFRLFFFDDHGIVDLLTALLSAYYLAALKGAELTAVHITFNRIVAPDRLVGRYQETYKYNRPSPAVKWFEGTAIGAKRMMSDIRKIVAGKEPKDIETNFMTAYCEQNQIYKKFAKDYLTYSRLQNFDEVVKIYDRTIVEANELRQKMPTNYFLSRFIKWLFKQKELLVKALDE